MPQLTRTTFGALFVLLVGASAFAQDARPGRPYRGLFAGGMPESAQSLVVNATTGTGWDTNVTTDIDVSGAENGILKASPLKSAGYGVLSGGLTYTASGQRLRFGASTSTNARYYWDLSDPVIASHSGNVAIGFTLSPSTRLNASYSIAYQPFSSLNLYPGFVSPASDGFDTIPGAIAPDLDLRGQKNEYWTYAAGAGVVHKLSDRSDVAANYSYNTTDFTAFSGNSQSQSASGRYTRRLTQNLSLRLGYGYTESRPARSDAIYRNHNLDSGIDYSRALSLSRRTTVGFSTGATAIDNGTTTRFDVLGGAHLAHEIGRTWVASAAYSRNLQFIEILNQTVFSDAVNVGLTGLLSRRLQVNASTAASSSSLTVTESGDRLWTYSSTANLTVGVTRYLGLMVGYSFYRYSVEGAAFRLLGLDSDLNRHSVRVVAAAWAPIFQKGRRQNAAR